MKEPIGRVCVGCGAQMQRPTKLSQVAWSKRRYCTRKCKIDTQPNVMEDYEVTSAGCWKWLGRIDRNGYGKAYDPDRPAGKRVDWSHRVSFRKHRGEIPEGYELDHVCENTACINPDHLDPVTKVEHARRTFQRLGKDDLHKRAADLRMLNLTYAEIAETVGLAGKESAKAAVDSAIQKGLVKASDIPTVHHLNDDDRADIVALYLFGIPQREIAAWYGVDDSQISRICNGKRSGHSSNERDALRRERRTAA